MEKFNYKIYMYVNILYIVLVKVMIDVVFNSV